DPLFTLFPYTTLFRSSEEGIFPPILIQMTMVGESTGNLDDTLLRLSRYFESESDLAIKAATTLIEPAVLIILGVAVGVLVTSIRSEEHTSELQSPYDL